MDGKETWFTSQNWSYTLLYDSHLGKFQFPLADLDMASSLQCGSLFLSLFPSHKCWSRLPNFAMPPIFPQLKFVCSRLIRFQDLKFSSMFLLLLYPSLFLYLHMAQPLKSPPLWSMQSHQSSCTSMHFAHLPNWRWQSQMRSVLMWGAWIGRRTGSCPDRVCLGHSFHCWHWRLGCNHCPHVWHRMSQW